ncbi:MAG TPA: leucyl aminopeptidase family protein, partial [Rhodanobacteraceae bacterium]
MRRALGELTRGRRGVRLEPLDRARWRTRQGKLSARERRWAQNCGFDAGAGQLCLIPDARGELARVLAGVDVSSPPFALGALPLLLPHDDYVLDDGGLGDGLIGIRDAALGWALGAYRYTRYVAPQKEPARLLLPRAVLNEVAPLLDAITQVRDLINTPSQDLGPLQLCEAVRDVARGHGAECKVFEGETLKREFPTVHAVGRASSQAPRVARLRWGKSSDPLLAIIGKGVTFDSGGLDIKTSDGMRWMKKDMGGAAHALALAQRVMASNLPVQLLLVIPTVDNAVAGDAMRPGDVIRTRAGITVEVDNTDAEGRLILCDAL